MESTGAIPKVGFKQHPVRLCTNDPTAAEYLKRKTAIKKVTFNEIPIICETSKDPVSVNINRQRMSALPGPIAQVTRSAARPSHPSTINRNVGEVKTKKPQCKPPPVRKINRKSSNSLITSVVSNQTSPNSEVVTDNVYAHPELNSSLHIAKKLQAIQLETFDPNKAVLIKLKECKVTKKHVDEKSSRMVNIPADKLIFHDVTPLEFDEQALLTAAAEEKEAKLKSVLPVIRRRDPEPDIEEFLTADMQPEFFAIAEPNYEFQALNMPAKAPLSLAYRLYKHKRMWEGLP